MTETIVNINKYHQLSIKRRRDQDELVCVPIIEWNIDISTSMFQKGWIIQQCNVQIAFQDKACK